MVSHLHTARTLAESLGGAVHLYRRTFTRFLSAMVPPTLLLVAINVVIPLFRDIVTFMTIGSVLLSVIVVRVYHCAAAVIADQLGYAAPPARMRRGPLLQLIGVTYLTFVGSAISVAVAGAIAALVAWTAGDCRLIVIGLGGGGGCEREGLGVIAGLAVVGIAALVLFEGLRRITLVGPAAIAAQRVGLRSLRVGLAQTPTQRRRSRHVLGVLVCVHGSAYVIAGLLWQLVWEVLVRVEGSAAYLQLFAEHATLPVTVVVFLAVLPVQAILFTLIYLGDTGDS